MQTGDCLFSGHADSLEAMPHDDEEAVLTLKTAVASLALIGAFLIGATTPVMYSVTKAELIEADALWANFTLCGGKRDPGEPRRSI